MVFRCPFCSGPITPDTLQCPHCNRSYSFDTLSFIRRSQKRQEEYTDERRKHTRYPVKLIIVFLSPQDFADHYVFDLSAGGLFVETKTPLQRGEELLLRISFLDKTTPLEIPGEVRWSRKHASRTPDGKRLPSGMGVEFSKLSEENLQRLIKILNRSLS